MESNLDRLLAPMLERVERTRQTLEDVRARSERRLGLTPRPQPDRRAFAGPETTKSSKSADVRGGKGAGALALAEPEDGDAVERIERERARARVARAESQSEAYRRRLAALARGDAESYVSLVAQQQRDLDPDAVDPVPPHPTAASPRTRPKTGTRRTPTRKKPATARKSPAKTTVRGRRPSASHRPFAPQPPA